MDNEIYIAVILSANSLSKKEMVFTDPSLARETYFKALKRMDILHPEIKYKTGQMTDGTVFTRFSKDGETLDHLEMVLRSAPVMTEIYPQVAVDFIDESENAWAVDAWPTTDECDENGRTVAYIDVDDMTVRGLNDYEHCVNVYNAIEDNILHLQIEKKKEQAKNTI